MANPINAITTYVRSSLAELKKVTWPTKETTFRYSMLVIIVSLGVAAFFATLDFAFSRAITFVLSQGKQSSAPAAEQPPVPISEPVTEPITVEAEDADAIGTEGTAPEGEAPQPNDGASDGITLPPIE